MSKPNFDDSYKTIEGIVEKYRYKWKLKAVPSVSFDDVKMIIIAHINVKWALFNPKRGSLEAWVNATTHNQFHNILRNIYGNISRPCLKCHANLGGTGCSLYGEQNCECALYEKWFKSKSSAYNIKLPLPIENHSQEVYSKPSEYIDLENYIDGFHEKIKKILKPTEWKIYKMAYIQGKPDEDIAKSMGYRTSEKNRINGYKRIRQLKNEIYSKAKKMLRDEGVEGFYTSRKTK